MFERDYIFHPVVKQWFDGEIYIKDTSGKPLADIHYALAFTENMLYQHYAQWEPLEIRSKDPSVAIEISNDTTGRCSRDDDELEGDNEYAHGLCSRAPRIKISFAK